MKILSLLLITCVCVASESGTPAPEPEPTEPAGYMVDVTFGEEIVGAALLKRIDHTINSHDVFVVVGGQYLYVDVEERFSSIKSETEANCVGALVGAGYSKSKNNWRFELGINLGIGVGYYKSDAKFQGSAGDDEGTDLYIYNEAYGRAVYKNVGLKIGMGVFDGEESLIYGASYNW